MRTLLAISLLCTGCATGKPAPGVPNAVVEDTFLRFSAADAAAASDDDLRASMSNACSGPCDHVYMAFDATTPVDVLQRVVTTATTVQPLPRVYLVPPSGKRIELVLAQAPCSYELTVHATGADVIRDGERLAADTTCAQWNAAICRGEDQIYDWPRLRSELGAIDELCVALSPEAVAELPTIHAMLRQPRVHFVPPKSDTAAIGEDSLTAVIKSGGPDLQWCLDGEVAEELVPMQATLRLAVHTDGRVTRAEVVDATRTTAQFETCIADVASKWQFPSPGSAATIVEIPLAFEPGARAPRRRTPE